VAQFRRFIQETGHRTKAEKSGMGSSSLNPLTGEMYEKSGLNWQNPGYSISDNHPVSQISWEDANRFAVWLGKKEGKKYRLPTEAEWEYAARAGTKTTFSSGNSYGSLHGFANVSDQSRTSQLQPEDYADLAPFNDGYADASPVGSYRPNSLGLYDMHGNVWEWCYDTYHSNAYSNSKAQNPFSKKESEKRVMRGGCFM
jgi:formylglycine-generating enzyme required for sulfatase activity